MDLIITTMVRNIFLLLGISILTLSSCALSKSTVTDEVVPDTSALVVNQVTVSADGRVEIFADKVETFNEEDYSIFYGAKVSEINRNGVKILEGGADRIEVQGNQDGIASGNVFVNNLEDKSTIRADTMNLDGEDRKLTGQGLIQVHLSDGLMIMGETFEADLAKKTYVFTNEVKGTIEFSDDE